jgi:hypothetical protein
MAEGTAAWTFLVISSSVSGVAFALIFTRLISPDTMRTIRKEIVGHVLEIRIFRDDFRVFTDAWRSIFRLSLRYLGHILPQCCLLVLPVVIIYWLLDPYLGHRPLLPGEQAILSLVGRVDALPERREVLLTSGGGKMENFRVTKELIIPEKGEVSWRVTALGDVSGLVGIRVDDVNVSARLHMGRGLERVIEKADLSGSLWRSLIYPLDGEKRGAWSGFLQISYPERHYRFLGFQFHWFLWFSFITLLTALLTPRFLRGRLRLRDFRT